MVSLNGFINHQHKVEEEVISYFIIMLKLFIIYILLKLLFYNSIKKFKKEL